MTDLDELRAELDEFAKPEKPVGRSAEEERVIAGFEEIQRFVEEHGRAPQHGEDRDIFERIYAVRLDRLRVIEACRSLLAPMDHQGLLDGSAAAPDDVEQIDDDELLAELRGEDASGLSTLRHVRTSAEKRAAEEIGNRTVCQDFDEFKPLFEKVARQLKNGERQTCLFETKSVDAIREGSFFIVGGQVAYVARVGEEFAASYDGRPDAKLRVIYDNGTEGDLLMRSLQRALHRDEAARLITEPMSLFGSAWEDGDVESGTIYVLRSRSDHEFVAAHRDLIHKIGVTGSSVETRIAAATKDSTYLLADVEIVATYKLVSINRVKLENLLHRIFAPAQIEITIEDRFGHPVKPREWFLVPLHVIDEAVQHIIDGSITDLVYDPSSAQLVKARK